jgi:hypothetical protein
MDERVIWGVVPEMEVLAILAMAPLLRKGWIVLSCKTGGSKVL